MADARHASPGWHGPPATAGQVRPPSTRQDTDSASTRSTKRHQVVHPCSLTEAAVTIDNRPTEGAMIPTPELLRLIQSNIQQEQPRSVGKGSSTQRDPERDRLRESTTRSPTLPGTQSHAERSHETATSTPTQPSIRSDTGRSHDPAACLSTLPSTRSDAERSHDMATRTPTQPSTRSDTGRSHDAGLRGTQVQRTAITCSEEEMEFWKNPPLQCKLSKKPPRLYDMRNVRKPELWRFVKLSAHPDH